MKIHFSVPEQCVMTAMVLTKVFTIKFYLHRFHKVNLTVIILQPSTCDWIIIYAIMAYPLILGFRLKIILLLL